MVAAIFRLYWCRYEYDLFIKIKKKSSMLKLNYDFFFYEIIVYSLNSHFFKSKVDLMANL